MNAVVPGRFDGRTIVVTGAGSGIGRATANRLLAEGARVIGTDVVPDRMEELAAEHKGESLIAVIGDVTAQETIDELLAAAGPDVWGLANVAGIMDGFVPTAEIDDAAWERVMSVNVTGPMRLMRALLPVIIARGGGSIVNVASEAGVRGSSAGTAYTTSKHAAVGLTVSTAFFYTQEGVRVNAVAPGAVATNVEGAFRSEFAAKRIGPILGTNVPAPASADQLAAAICWLLSEDSSYVSGAVLQVDGGWAAV